MQTNALVVTACTSCLPHAHELGDWSTSGPFLWQFVSEHIACDRGVRSRRKAIWPSKMEPSGENGSVAEVSEQDAEQAEIAKARGNTAFQGVKSVLACRAPPPMHGSLKQAGAVMHSMCNPSLRDDRLCWAPPLDPLEHTDALMSGSRGYEGTEMMQPWRKTMREMLTRLFIIAMVGVLQTSTTLQQWWPIRRPSN